MLERREVYSDELELAATLLAADEIAANLASQRDIISRAMLGHSALHQVTDQARAEKLEQAGADIRLFEQFTESVLPVVNTDATGAFKWVNELFFPINDYEQANAIQALTLWCNVGITQGTQYDHINHNSIKQVPFFLLGSRPISPKNSEVILATPARRATGGKLDTNVNCIKPVVTIVKPALFTAEISTTDLETIDQGFEHRLTHYINQAQAADELPQELRRAVESGRWPNEGSDIARLRTSRLGRAAAVKVSLQGSMQAEHIADGITPLTSFDYPRRMLNLAIAFDEVAAFKTALAERAAARRKSE